MVYTSIFNDILSWVAGIVIFSLGVLNLFLVHPVPGIVYLLLSLLFLPPINLIMQKSLGFRIPAGLKIVLFFVIIWFTLGVSDLGDMMDDGFREISI